MRMLKIMNRFGAKTQSENFVKINICNLIKAKSTQSSES
jgi:hypothetical protein